jgi:hypothetical protein
MLTPARALGATAAIPLESGHSVGARTAGEHAVATYTTRQVTVWDACHGDSHIH